MTPLLYINQILNMRNMTADELRQPKEIKHHQALHGIIMRLCKYKNRDGVTPEQFEAFTGVPADLVRKVLDTPVEHEVGNYAASKVLG